MYILTVTFIYTCIMYCLLLIYTLASYFYMMYSNYHTCIGIFATHLHELFKLPLRLKYVTNKRMGVTLDPITNGKMIKFLLCMTTVVYYT